MTETIDAPVEFNRLGTAKEGFQSAGAVILLLVAGQVLGSMVGMVKYLTAIAVHPMQADRLYAIVTYAFGHVSTYHLLMNSLQLGVISFFTTVLLGRKHYWIVALAVLLGSGLFVWFEVPAGAMVVGASGVTAGLASYLLVRSALPMDAPIFSMASLFVCLIGIGIATSLKTNNPQVSWQAHAGGLVVGLLIAVVPMVKRYRKTGLLY